MFVADIDMWTIWTLPVADLVFSVADIVVADTVCGRYRCNLLQGIHYMSTCFRIFKSYSEKLSRKRLNTRAEEINN